MKKRQLRNREIALTVFLFLFLPCVFPAVFTFSGCGKKENAEQNKFPDDIYSLEVIKDRKKKDLYFLSDANSPLKAADREYFKGLNYYPPTREFVFPCVLQHHQRAKEFTIQTSKQKPRQMLNIGYMEFTYRNRTHRLQVYAPKDTSQDGMYYFLPFNDATNGVDTYAGGRYLDFEVGENDSLFLDFNYSYDPYCAYNEKYDCPIPPAENRLPIPIRAGEKLFGNHPH